MNLYELNKEWEQVFNMLENPEIDNQAVFDTIESIESNIDSKADGYGKIIRMLQGNIAMADEEIKRLQSRKKTLENREKCLKDNLYKIMKNIGKPTIDTGLFKFWYQKNAESVEIAEDFNIEDLPDEYAIPQPPKINKTKIKEAIKDGWEIPWATIKQTESLRMR